MTIITHLDRNWDLISHGCSTVVVCLAEKQLDFYSHIHGAPCKNIPSYPFMMGFAQSTQKFSILPFPFYFSKLDTEGLTPGPMDGAKALGTSHMQVKLSESLQKMVKLQHMVLAQHY